MTAMALFYSSAFCKNICGLLVLAEEALHPLKLSLSNFNQDIKAFTNYCQLHLHNIIGSGGQISHTHWIRIQESLEEAYTEKFWLQMMDWSKNWRKQTGEGHDWTMMQYLAKVDLEYSRLLNLNQWKMNDPNSTIVALHAEIADQKVALQATKPPPPSGQQKQKPTWVPKDGQPLEVTHIISGGSIAVAANVGNRLIPPQSTNQNPPTPSLLKFLRRKLVQQQIWPLAVPHPAMCPSHHRYQNLPLGKAL